ncbi:MAG: MarR family transcriptional regulator [Rhodospirillaceae bacterium]|mgnify:CR=1 FL=1|nr:MarR family transcriptional regulator [Rhodospirillaceae bacterium]|tara:strand:+ start:274 stop:786 length:513 start_codon:yes stop_codon:yes gene_type:complete
MATAMPKQQADSDTGSEKDITEIYLQITRMIERLHRRHLDMLRFELDRIGVEGISAAQALMMTKIKGQSISVRDLVERGYYFGSNASYNIKQLVKCGFVIQERSPHDRRSMRLKLTDQGEDLCTQIEIAEAAHAKSLAEDVGEMSEIAGASQVLRNLENTWSNYLRYGDH